MKVKSTICHPADPSWWMWRISIIFGEDEWLRVPANPPALYINYRCWSSSANKSSGWAAPTTTARKSKQPWWRMFPTGWSPAARFGGSFDLFPIWSKLTPWKLVCSLGFSPNPNMRSRRFLLNHGLIWLRSNSITRFWCSCWWMPTMWSSLFVRALILG